MSIRASAAIRDITPTDLPPLAGYPGEPRIATTVKDPLLVSAVHLRGGAGGVIALSLDLFSLDPPCIRLMRQRIAQATGTRESNIFIGTTRNRAAPWTWRSIELCAEPSYAPPDPNYINFIVEQSVQAAAESAVASRPATVASIPMPAPCTGAFIIRETPSNRILAILAVLTEPIDLIGPLNTAISAGPIASTRSGLASRLSGKPVLVCFSGADAERKVAPPKNPETPQSPESQGVSLAEKLATIVKQIPPSAFSDKVAFTGELQTVDDLSYRKTPSELDAANTLANAAKRLQLMRECGAKPEQLLAAAWEAEDARAIMATIIGRKKGRDAGILDELEPVQIQVLRIGNTRLLGMPLTVTSSAARELAAKSPTSLWLAQSVNGDLQGSALFLDESCPSGYRLAGALFTPESGNAIFRAAMPLAF